MTVSKNLKYGLMVTLGWNKGYVVYGYYKYELVVTLVSGWDYDHFQKFEVWTDGNSWLE